MAAKNATTTIPVVFVTGADPVKVGLVSNVRQPGGNVTGITFFTEELGAKSLSLLNQLVPYAKTVGLMVNPLNPETPRRAADAVAAARALGLEMELLYAATPSDIDKVFADAGHPELKVTPGVTEFGMLATFPSGHAWGLQEWGRGTEFVAPAPLP